MIVSALLLAAARGSVLLLAAAIGASALRSRPAALRHSIWTLAIASQLVLPLAALLMPQRAVRLGRADAFMTRAAAAVASAVASPIVPEAAAPRTPAPQPVPSETWTALQLLALVWSAGAMLVCLRFIVGTILVARETRRAARPVSREWIVLSGTIQETMQLRRTAALRWGTERAVPYTWGVIAPVVCLPGDADTWTPDRLRIVLAHELAHVERFDALTELVAQVALVIYWFNPLLWLAVRRMRAEREHACDDRVLMGGVKPSDYVEELLAMMKAIGGGATKPAFGAIAMAQRSQFESRMLAVLDESSQRHVVGRESIALVAMAMMALLLGVASVRPAAANTAPPRLSGAVGPAAVAWSHSDFDAMVEDCNRTKPRLHVQYCEVRNIDLSMMRGTVTFDGGYIDGVIYTSRDRSAAATARALVRTEAPNMSDARALAAQVTTSAAKGSLRSEGPGGGRSNIWSVLYEVSLPAGRSVMAHTELGQIALRDFQGNANIVTVNGPLQVFGAAGDIKGRTESGPIFVGLAGERWEGGGLDLQSQNGPIYLAIPERYSGHLVTGTTNGPLQLSYPVHVRRMTEKRIEADIGAGGPTVRVTTLNGLANIR